jgi:hypothetical protein
MNYKDIAMVARLFLIGMLSGGAAFAAVHTCLAQKADFRNQVNDNRRNGATDADAARDVLERNAKRKEELRQRLEDLKKWTDKQFEIGEREVIDRPKLLARRLKNLEKDRENELFRLLNFPEDSTGGIESGKALNTLVERLGPAARDNVESRKMNPLYGIPLADGTTGIVFDEKLLSHLSWQENTLGAKAGGKLNQDPIDINWPKVLQEARWAENRQAIEKARESILTGLRSGKGVSAELEEQIRDAVGQLNTDFAAYFKQWVQNPPPAAARPAEYQRLCFGKRHIEKLITSVYQVSDASSLEDVGPATKFPGGNVEELLAYFQANNLRFAPPSKPTDRSAYHTVFRQMVRYYLDLKAVANAEKEIDEEIGRLDRIDDQTVATALDHRAVVNVIDSDDEKLIRDLVR